MQNIINKIVGALIRLFAKLANQDPEEWLFYKALNAGLDQNEFVKLLEII